MSCLTRCQTHRIRGIIFEVNKNVPRLLPLQGGFRGVLTFGIRFTKKCALLIVFLFTKMGQAGPASLL